MKIITCHLGNGASICGVKFDKSVDTSIGYALLEGFILTTRFGNIDAAIILQIIAQEEITSHEIYNLLNRYSALLRIS